jgi:hypothetical protein
MALSSKQHDTFTVLTLLHLLFASKIPSYLRILFLVCHLIFTQHSVPFSVYNSTVLTD